MIPHDGEAQTQTLVRRRVLGNDVLHAALYRHLDHLDALALVDVPAARTAPHRLGDFDVEHRLLVARRTDVAPVKPTQTLEGGGEAVYVRENTYMYMYCVRKHLNANIYSSIMTFNKRLYLPSAASSRTYL